MFSSTTESVGPGGIPDSSAPTASRYPQRTRAPPQRFSAAAVMDAPATGVTEPSTYKEAISSVQSAEWQAAMCEEMESLLGNQTWTLEEAPPGARILPVKWVYKVKRGPDGQIQRFKARLVAKGFRQIEGVDFHEVFAPVSKHASLRTFLAKVAVEDLELHQLDVKTAFLNGDLEEVIYMQQPPGFEQGGPRIVCLLRKSLYGLKQAPRAWHLKLKQELLNLGFTPSEADPSVYVLHEADGSVYLAIYVDDILAASASLALLTSTESKLQQLFDIHNLGNAAHFLGMEITRDSTTRTLTLSQAHMVDELLDKYDMLTAKPRSTPMEAGLHLRPAESDDNLLDVNQFPYAELIGSLLYIAVCTRPDIAYAVNALARHMAKPTMAHWSAAKGVLRYLLGTAKVCLVYSPSASKVIGYCDADYAGDMSTRRSTTGYVFLVANAAVSWNSKLQVTVAVSTAEAEYMAASAAVKEALWLRRLMYDLRMFDDAVPIRTDNQASLALMKNPLTSQRAKHIDVQYHFVRERIIRCEVAFAFCPTANMVADCMTKSLPKAKFLFCKDAMGMH